MAAAITVATTVSGAIAAIALMNDSRPARGDEDGDSESGSDSGSDHGSGNYSGSVDNGVYTLPRSSPDNAPTPKVRTAANSEKTESKSPTVVVYDEAEVIAKLCAGHIDDIHNYEVVNALAFVAYEPQRAYSPNTNLYILHREKNVKNEIDADRGGMTIKPIDSDRKADLPRWVQGIPRIVHFEFEHKGKCALVYCVCGSSMLGDFVADISTGDFMKVISRSNIGPSDKTEVALALRKQPYHAGVLSYAANAYDMVRYHMRKRRSDSKKAPDSVLIYGHSLGGSVSLIVAHLLHLQGRNEDGLITDVTCVQSKTISAVNYMKGNSKLTLRPSETTSNNFFLENFCNAGDNIIFNPLFRKFNYPVDWSEGVGNTSDSHTHGVVKWGDLDPENVLGSLGERGRYYAGENSIAMNAFNHSYVSRDNTIYCTKPDAANVVHTLKFMCGRISAILRKRAIRRTT